MAILKNLTEQREDKAKALEELLTSAKTENRAFSVEEKTKFETLEGEIKAIDETIKAEERATALFTPKKDPKKTDKGNSEEDKDSLEERAFVNFVLDNQVELRTGEIQLTQGSNGSIVPTKISNKIITAVRDMVPFLQFADVQYTNGTLSVPVYGEDSTNYINAAYVDENTALTDNVGKFTTVNLTGFVIGALALVSKKLKDNTDIDVVSFIVNQVARAVAEKLEKEFVNGTTDKITGVISTDKGITAASSTAVTYDELIKLKHSLKQSFRAKAKLIMAPATYTAICMLKDDNGLPYFKENDYKVLGLDVIESDSMPAMEAGKKAIIIADLSGYTIKCTKSVEVQVLKELYANKNMLGVIAYGEFDAKITDTKKLAALTMKSST